MARRQQVVFEDPQDEALRQQAAEKDLASQLATPMQSSGSEPDSDVQPDQGPAPQAPRPRLEPDPADRPPEDPPPLGGHVPKEAPPQAQPEHLYPAPTTMPGSYSDHVNSGARAAAQLSKPIEPEILTPGENPVITYRQRIRVVEAYQYPGNLSRAPAWVDRNWAAWGEFDPLRNIAAGPAVRVPEAGGAVMARIGDYIVQEEVAITDDLSDIRVAVWARESFEKHFLPVKVNAPSMPLAPDGPTGRGPLIDGALGYGH